MHITASVTYDEKTINALTRTDLFRKADPKKRSRLLLVLFALLFPLVSFSCYLSGKYWLLVLYFVVLAMELFVFLLYPRIHYNAQKKLVGMENVYTFTDDGFTVTSHGNGQSGTSNLTYSFLCKAKETSEYFYLYPHKRQVFIVDKSTMSSLDALELRRKLHSVLGKKYFLLSY